MSNHDRSKHQTKNLQKLTQYTW